MVIIVGTSDACFDVKDGGRRGLLELDGTYESANDCKAHCLNTADCLAVEYNLASKKCNVITANFQIGKPIEIPNWTLFIKRSECGKLICNINVEPHPFNTLNVIKSGYGDGSRHLRPPPPPNDPHSPTFGSSKT